MGENSVPEIRCRAAELRSKDVISVEDGSRLGYVIDVEIDTCTANIPAIVIARRGFFGGLFYKNEEYIIPWKDIAVIGEDVILVRFSRPQETINPRRFFESLFQ